MRMFSFNRKIVESDIPLISDYIKTLIFDDEPILYVGKNRYGNYIIGSSVDEDRENRVEWFFHTVITFDDYQRFLRKEITYLDMLKDNNNIFIIEKSFDNSFVKVFPIDFFEIPEDYRPTSDSFFPDELNM